MLAEQSRGRVAHCGTAGIINRRNIKIESYFLRILKMEYEFVVIVIQLTRNIDFD